MRFRSLFLVFTLALLIIPIGCNYFAPIPIEASLKYGLMWLSNGSSNQATSSAEIITINSKEEQDSLKERFWSLASLPSIDYSRYQLLILQSPTMPDAMFSTRITSVKETESSIVIDMETIRGGGGLADAESCPYALFRINRSSKPYILGKTAK